MAEFSHIPVLLHEVLDGLAIKPSGIYLDGTVGGAGHAFEVASRLTTGCLVGLDRDPDAVAAATARLSGLPAHVVQCNFSDAPAALAGLGIQGIDGALLDLGVSSHQLDTAARGFSYHEDAPLDMRMSQSGLSAADVVNTYTREELTRVLRDYGEEQYAGLIAKKILQRRETGPIATTGQLTETVLAALPAAVRRKEKNPARKTFQAIRIEVNDELGALSAGLDAIFDLLRPGGRFCVLTFHSLEDRMVKLRFRDYCTGCICPPDFPVCVCGRKPRAKAVTRKALRATEEEMESNRRARSASLRIVEKL